MNAVSPRQLTSRLLFAGFVVLLLNSAYLATFADPSLWYFANVALHPLLGLTLAVAIALQLRHPMARVYARAIGLPARGADSWGWGPERLKNGFLRASQESSPQT